MPFRPTPCSPNKTPKFPTHINKRTDLTFAATAAPAFSPHPHVAPQTNNTNPASNAAVPPPAGPAWPRIAVQSPRRSWRVCIRLAQCSTGSPASSVPVFRRAVAPPAPCPNFFGASQSHQGLRTRPQPAGPSATLFESLLPPLRGRPVAMPSGRVEKSSLDQRARRWRTASPRLQGTAPPSRGPQGQFLMRE